MPKQTSEEKQKIAEILTRLDPDEVMFLSKSFCDSRENSNRHDRPSEDTLKMIEEIKNQLHEHRLADQQKTNEVLIVLQELKNHFDKDKDGIIPRIEAQTVKTNGRVNKLEAWKKILWGAWLVVVFGGSAFFYFYNKAQDNGTDLKILHALEQHDKDNK